MLPLAGVIDLEAERARLARERAKAEQEAEKIAKKLDNADFVAARPRRSWRRIVSACRQRVTR